MTIIDRIRLTVRAGLFTVHNKLADAMFLSEGPLLASRLNKHRLIGGQPKPPTRASRASIVRAAQRELTKEKRRKSAFMRRVKPRHCRLSVNLP